MDLVFYLLTRSTAAEADADTGPREHVGDLLRRCHRASPVLRDHYLLPLT